MAQKAVKPKQLVLEMVVWDKEWKDCHWCKNDDKKRPGCYCCCGAGGWYAARLSKF